MNRVSKGSSSPTHHISTLLSSPAPQKQGCLIHAGGRFAVFSSPHSRNVTVMVTSRAQWPQGPLPSNAKQWNENWVLTCMRHISVAPWFWLEVELDCLFPELSGGRARSGGMEGTGAEQVLQSRRKSGESWSECFKKHNLRKQSYCSQKWTLEWGEQLNHRGLSWQPVLEAKQLMMPLNLHGSCFLLWELLHLVSRK